MAPRKTFPMLMALAAAGLPAGTATLMADIESRWYVNSDGSQVVVSRPLYYLYLSAQMKADDGMDLPRYESFFATER